MRFVAAILLLCLLLPLAAARPLVRFATSIWPPYVGPQLEEQGLLADITREAFDRVGYDITINYMPWEEALRAAGTGQYDAVLGGSWTQEREEMFAFSQPYYHTANHLFSLRNAGIGYEKISDLRGRKIAVVSGYEVDPEFDDAPGLNKIMVRDLPQAIQMVLDGEAELLVEARAVVLYTLRDLFPKRQTELMPLYPPLHLDPVHNLFCKQSETWQATQEAFALGMKMIEEDGTYGQILERHGVGR